MPVGTLQPLTPERHRDAARIYADAFIDDPGWVAVGPGSRKRRWKWIYRTCLATARIAERWGGPSWCIADGDETLAALVGAAPGRWPPPQVRTLLHLAPGSILAGPGTLVRGLGSERIFEQIHPKYDHQLVWMFAVDPAHQRAGLGRRLIGEALRDADAAEVPAYLWTANPDNLPYYRSHGFEVFEERVIPGGVPNWFMERPPAGGVIRCATC